MLGRHGTVRVQIYCNNFNSSNAVVCLHLILAYTVRLAIINAVELEQNGWFFLFFVLTFIEECCVLSEKNIDKKLANRISYQIRCLKGCSKGKFSRGVQMRREVRVRCDTGIPGEKSGLKHPKPLQSLLSMNQVNLFKS